MTITDIRKILNGFGIEHTFFGDERTEISGFSDPRDYRDHTAIWIGKLADISFKPGKTTGDIALVFARTGSGVEEILPNTLLMEDPKNAFMKLVISKYGATVQEFRSPSAHISSEAVIGKDCYIGHNVVIEEGAVIGDGCEIRENTYIGKNCVLGPCCVIGQNVVIGGETNGSYFEDSDGLMKNMPNTGRVVIGRSVQIGACCVIAKATFTETVIGDECEMNAGTSIGHNCHIGKRVQLLGSCTLSGNVNVGDCSVLISALVKNRITIGDNVKVGIGSVVLKDIPSKKTCFGNPARVIPD